MFRDCSLDLFGRIACIAQMRDIATDVMRIYSLSVIVHVGHTGELFKSARTNRMGAVHP